MNLYEHPLYQQIYDASQAVEACGASVPLTNAVCKVSALYEPVKALVDRVKELETQLEEARAAHIPQENLRVD